MDAVTAKNWTPLSYAKAKGKYGATEEKGIYPEVCYSQIEIVAPAQFRCFKSGIVYRMCSNITRHLCTDQALWPLGVAAHAKAMTHMQTISCEKGAAIKILWNILSVSHAAHMRLREVSMATHQCAMHRLFASQGRRVSTIHSAMQPVAPLHQQLISAEVAIEGYLAVARDAVS